MLVGATTGAWAGDNAGGYDFVGVSLDVGSPTSASLRPVPTQAPEPGASPSPAPTDVVNESMQPSTPGSVATQAPTRDTYAPSSRPTLSPSLAADEVPLSPMSEATSTPTPNTDEPLSMRPTPSPTLPADGGGLNTTTTVAVVFGALCFIGMVGAGWLCRRQARKRKDAAGSDVWYLRNPADDPDLHFSPARIQGVPSPRGDTPQYEQHEDGYPSPPLQHKRAVTEATSLASSGIVPTVPGVHVGSATSASLQLSEPWGKVVEIGGERGSHEGHPPSIVAAPMKGIAERSSNDDEEALNVLQESDEGRNRSNGRCRKPIRDVGVVEAVIRAAQDLARMSQIPGVAEASGLVIVLMNMVTDSSDIVGEADSMVKRCRTVMLLLQRATGVFVEVSWCRLRRPLSCQVAFVVCQSSMGRFQKRSASFTSRS